MKDKTFRNRQIYQAHLSGAELKELSELWEMSYGAVQKVISRQEEKRLKMVNWGSRHDFFPDSHDMHWLTRMNLGAHKKRT